LPEEWQLSFYNTQFRCAYLPSEVWRKASPELIDAWLDETQEGFRFVLQAPGSMSEEDRLQASRFDGRAVLEGQADLVWLEGKPDLRNLAQRMLMAAQGGKSLFLISRNGVLGDLGRVRELMEVLGV
jgi:uncharacterized protein YecE (DUF72 family)